MSTESANMDHFFRQLETGYQPDLSAMDQHWQQLKELTSVSTPPSGSTGSSLFKPGLWIGAGLIGAAAWVIVLINQSKKVAAPPVPVAVTSPRQTSADTLPVTKPAVVKMPRTGTRRVTSGPAPVAESTDKIQRITATPAPVPQDNIVQPYPGQVSEPPNRATHIKTDAGKAKDSLYLTPVNKNRKRSPGGIIHLTQPVKNESNGRIRFDTVKSTVPAHTTNVFFYTLSASQQKWLRSLPGNLTSFLNP